ncbi:MAG: amidohydrolase family protein [Proteobacteria bacterium]|nr:amidohydrolase family protein [Pseudomonadota bacterium]
MPMGPEERQAWLDQVSEEIIDPGRPIVDPHHHLWPDTRGVLAPYLLNDLWRDTQSGHHVVDTVFMECGASYLEEGPVHLRPTGETEFVAAQARRSRDQGKAEISGIIGHVDLMLDEVLIREALSAHEEAGEGLFRGIRHGGAHDPDKVLRWGDATPLPDLYERPEFRRGVKLLGSLGYTYDTWHYHFQNQAFVDLARAVPDTLLVLDHFGSPVGVGPWADRRDEVFDTWQRDMLALAACENVVVKIGGLAMPPNGFGWHSRVTPATSDELVTAQRDYYDRTIECFGPDRCMFESNFPVDRMSVSYHVYWNAMKKISAAFSEDDKDLLFQGTARRVYRV